MEGERVSVSFTCQRCLQPVILDDSFLNMDDYARAELACEYSPSEISVERNKNKNKSTFPFFSANLCEYRC